MMKWRDELPPTLWEWVLFVLMVLFYVSLIALTVSRILAASVPIPVPQLVSVKQLYHINLTWNTVSNISTYGFYQGNASGIYTKETLVGTNWFTVTNANRTNVYFFAVTAVDTNGVESDFSNEAQWPEPKTNYYALYPQVSTNLAQFSDISTNPFLRLTNIFLELPTEYYRIRIAVSTNWQ